MWLQKVKSFFSFWSQKLMLIIIIILQAKMLMVLGDSYAHRMRSHLDPAGQILCRGWPGARLGQESFRHWAVKQAKESKPDIVLLMIGGNDVARKEFRQRKFLSELEELALGLLAAGAREVRVWPVPPRTRLRKQDVSVACFRKRRHLLNHLMTKELRGECRIFPAPSMDKMLGADGVHPSELAWGQICASVAGLL